MWFFPVHNALTAIQPFTPGDRKMNTTARRYAVIDRRTGTVVKTFAKLIPAHHYAQQLDLEHGSTRYSVRTVAV